MFFAAALFLVGCQGLAPFIQEVGNAAQPGGIPVDTGRTTGEALVEAIELARPALPPVVGIGLSALLSGAAVYAHGKQKKELGGGA